MKAVCVKTYYDKELHRTVGKGEPLELSPERFEQLSTVNNDEKVILVMERAENKPATKKSATKKEEQ